MLYRLWVQTYVQKEFLKNLDKIYTFLNSLAVQLTRKQKARKRRLRIDITVYLNWDCRIRFLL